MDKSRASLLGFLFLPMLLLGGMLAFEFFATPKGTQAAPNTEAPTAAPAGASPAAVAPATAQPTGAQLVAREASKRTVTIETDTFVATFSNLSSALTSLRVKGERYDVDGKPYNVVTTSQDEYLPGTLRLTGVAIPTDAIWNVELPESGTVVFTWSGNGFDVKRTWTASRTAYALQSTVQVTNTSDATREVIASVSTGHFVPASESNQSFAFIGRPSTTISQAACHTDGDDLKELGDDMPESAEEAINEPKVPARASGKIEFVAISNTYFATVIAPTTGEWTSCTLYSSLRGGTLENPDGTLFEAGMSTGPTTLAPSATQSFATSLYLGPKNTEALKAFGHGAENVIDLGWFSFIARGMNDLLTWIHDYVGNWGIAIILLTVLVRFLLLPFIIPQFRSMAKQRALKPEIDRINELYKNDREKKGAALMELWRREKVNPIGGCLPVLLQMPIFFALYQSLSTNVEIYHAPFALWWTDLSTPDPYFVLPLVLGVLMLIQQKLTPVQMDPVQAKVMLWVMPAMMTFFMLLLPTGLCLYMVTNSALGIVQQRYMYWKMDKEAATALSGGKLGDSSPSKGTQHG